MDEYHGFEGHIEKIVIESEDSGFCPPAPGQEIRQRLTLHRNGNVALTRYFSGDFSQVPPTEDTKTMRRYRNKPTEKIMENYIAEYFREFHEPIIACDAGMWIIALTNTEGETWTFDGSLVDDLELYDYKLSVLTRRVLEMPELWLFDGGEEESVIKTIKGDITKIDDVEAIVNAANNSLLGGGGDREPELLASCYYNSLKVAADSGIRSIAFPSISTGVYGYPVEKAAREAVAAVKRFLDSNPDTFDLVEWVLFDDRTLAAYEAEVDKLY